MAKTKTLTLPTAIDTVETAFHGIPGIATMPLVSQWVEHAGFGITNVASKWRLYRKPILAVDTPERVVDGTLSEFINLCAIVYWDSELAPPTRAEILSSIAKASKLARCECPCGCAVQLKTGMTLDSQVCAMCEHQACLVPD